MVVAVENPRVTSILELLKVYSQRVAGRADQ